jgi:uncharacterized protein YbjT (DUF2867 family)
VAAEELVLISRSTDKLAALHGHGCAVRRGDFDDPDSMASSLHDVDVETLLGRPPERFSDFIARHRDALRAMVREDVR